MKLVRVPLRISLCGGGSDIPSHFEKYGGSVVSFTIDKYIYISAKPNISLFPHRYRLVYSKVEECNERSEIKHPIIRQLVSDYGIGALDLDVMSDIPAGTGMGSSSAFTVGLHKALSTLDFNKHELASLACKTEISDLKEPIGLQDQYAAAFGGLNLFEFTAERVIVRPISINAIDEHILKKRLHLIYVGGTRSASQQLKEQSTNDNSGTLGKLDATAQVAATYLRIGEIDKLGEAIRHGWELKKQLSPNVSTPHIDTIIDTALKHGATGGKLLGAGGAGFVLLFCPPEKEAKMLDGLRPLNLTHIPFNFDFEGAKTLYEDG